MSHERREGLVSSAYPEVEFGGFSRVDGLVAFYGRVQALLQPEFTALDVGCGRGSQADDRSPFRKHLRTFRGRCRHVIGIDLDPIAGDNPFLDEFRRMETPQKWPIDDSSIDLLLSDCVLEHVSDPAAFFAEAGRVVKPGGFICLRTPNALSYVALVARIMPNRLHRRILRTAQPTRQEDDVFPTLYRCNRKGLLRRFLRDSGFDAVVYRHEGQPAYLTFSPALYRAMAVMTRHIPDFFKTTLVAFGRRK